MPNIVKGWIEVDEIFCKGCELCIAACPMNVLELDIDKFTAKGYHPVKLKSEECTGCAICAIVCPEAALTVCREKQAKEKEQVSQPEEIGMDSGQETKQHEEKDLG